jgi:predicted TIM-barrel fold metal-dependent hydrolase
MTDHRYPVFDADGHVWENDEELAQYFEEPYASMERFKTFSVFPSLDGWARGFLAPEMDNETNAEVWGHMLDEMGAEGTVLYPTAGLAHGLNSQEEWAHGTAVAYNNWLEDRYTAKDDRLHGVGLMSVLNVDDAITELRRCKTERTRMVAMMLPSVTATGRFYGDEYYWPLYEEAQRLDMPLSLHGGPSSGAAYTQMKPFIKVHTLEHPVPLFIQLTDLVFSGVFEEFPGVRFGFLEAGSSWVPWMMDKLDAEYSWIGHQAPKLSKEPSKYISEGNNFWVGAEVDERGLKYTIDAIGSDRIMFPSDYPHERKHDDYIGDIPELLARDDVSEESKQKILYNNALTFYGLQ